MRSGGEWLIRQHPPSGHGGWLTERITIAADADGAANPIVSFKLESAMVFMYADGREIVFPWANIVRAEYRPHPQP